MNDVFLRPGPERFARGISPKSEAHVVLPLAGVP